MPGSDDGDASGDEGEADARHILVNQAAEVVARIKQAGEARGASAKEGAVGASGAAEGAGAGAAAGASGRAGARVAIVLDNCGLEFVSDLAMVDALLKSGLASHVELHCKVPRGIGRCCYSCACDAIHTTSVVARVPHCRSTPCLCRTCSSR